LDRFKNIGAWSVSSPGRVVQWFVNRASISDRLCRFASCLDGKDYQGYAADCAGGEYVQIPEPTPTTDETFRMPRRRCPNGCPSPGALLSPRGPHRPGDLRPPGRRLVRRHLPQHGGGLEVCYPAARRALGHGQSAPDEGIGLDAVLFALGFGEEAESLETGGPLFLTPGRPIRPSLPCLPCHRTRAGGDLRRTLVPRACVSSTGVCWD